MQDKTKKSTEKELQEAGIYFFENLTGTEVDEKVDLRERACSNCKNKVPYLCSICYICETEDNI